MANSSGRIAIIVPCYNEAARLDVKEFRLFAEENPGIHLIFVDDGSTDKTLDVVEAVRLGNEASVSVLPCSPNCGKGEAVRLGILHAMDTLELRMVGFWDADLATPLDAILPFTRVLDEKSPIKMVFGARVKLLGREVNRRAVRHYPGRAFATVVSSLLRMSIYDTQCGAKLFRVEPETRKIFEQRFISKWVFDVEILARYMSVLRMTPEHLAAAIYEYPLEKWTDVAGSKLGPGDFFTAFIDVWHIYRKYL